MTLQEAIASGRPFKLGSGYWLVAASGMIVEEKGGRTVSFYRPQELLSTEWVVKEPETWLTKTHFEKIWARIEAAYKGTEVTRESLFKILCEELGLRGDIQK